MYIGAGPAENAAAECRPEPTRNLVWNLLLAASGIVFLCLCCTCYGGSTKWMTADATSTKTRPPTPFFSVVNSTTSTALATATGRAPSDRGSVSLTAKLDDVADDEDTLLSEEVVRLLCSTQEVLRWVCPPTLQPVCYYRPRRAWGSQTSRHDCDTAEALVGRSFWRVDGEISPFLTGGNGHVSRAGSGSSSGRRVMLPLKRGRLSASPATGLIGLQENEFLGDFFDCLGFLSLTSESTVRGAMVGVMLAGGWPPHNYHSTAPAMSLVGEEAGAVRQAVGGSNDVTGDSTWSSALAAGSGPGAPPRDQSTCALWCAIALGALVRGSPLDQVGRYVDLAQESLWACYDGATLDTTRAYISMAVLHNILGEQVKSYQYYKLANSIMDELPPQEIPREFRELLKYAGFAWAIETEVASAEDTNSYWTSMPSVWQPLMCEDSARHLLIKQQQLYEAAPVGTVLPIEDLDQLEAEVDRVCLENSEACAEAQKSVMPEVLRLEECIESELTYLKLLTKEASLKELKATVQGCVEVIVRYPGLCRYNTWLHYVHILLEILAAFRSRQQYETTRVAYNSVRPAGALPAPPFEEWRMSDVCEHAFCRRLTMRLQSIYSEYLEARSGRPAPE